jgi:hypothetical protein
LQIVNNFADTLYVAYQKTLPKNILQEAINLKLSKVYCKIY